MKTYDVLTVHGDREMLDIVIAVGSELPITGMLDHDNAISLYFNENECNQDTLAELRSWIPQTMEAQFIRSTVEEQNWNAEFEASLEPVAVNDRLVITQSWNDAPINGDQLTITIDPKMSFGTGHHESTRLIADLLTEIPLAGKSLLDAGTGTGILAIIGALSGAKPIVAFDNNEWAVANSHENIALNNVDELIELHQCELAELPEQQFDVIAANIHLNVILKLLPDFVARFSSSDGVLLTSGILIADYDILLKSAEEHGLSALKERRENEWVATVFGHTKNS